MIAELNRPPSPILTDCSLGVGLYSPAEAAMYARVKTQTLKRWVFGDGQGEAAFTPQITGGEERTVSFLDFIQAMAVRAIRTQFDIPLPRIRTAVDLVESTLGILYPFARQHKTYVIREGSAKGELAIEINNRVIQISGKLKKQHLIGPIAELYMDKVEFGTDGLACEYTAWKAGPDSIRMNPHLRFGEPIVAGCGYTARALWEAVQNEGSIKDAAEAYGVPEKQIRLACEYFDHLINRDIA